MKKLQFGLIVILVSFCGFAQSDPCGSVINDAFDEAGTLPTEWT